MARKAVVVGGLALILVAAITVAIAGRGLSGGDAARDATVGVARGPIRDVATHPFSPTPDPATAIPVAAASVDNSETMEGLTLVRPRFRRGGYGAKAMLSFTIQNRNDFDVKDVAMRCEFGGRDGRFTTARTRVLNDTVKMKSRKRYGPTLIGFVGVAHSQARCAIVNASRAERI